MYLSIVCFLLGFCSIHAQSYEFTINRVELVAYPSTNLKNGQQLDLNCVVHIAKTIDLTLFSTIYFYKNDVLVYDINTTKQQQNYTIQKARVSNSGNYKCVVRVEKREKTSEELTIKVTGLSAPSINVSMAETIEGEDVTVRCDAPEEESTLVFTFYKMKSDGRERAEMKIRQSSSKYALATFQTKEGENILRFECEVKMFEPEEKSPPSKIVTVTVTAPFSIPEIEVSPSRNFTEGNKLLVQCKVQMPERSKEEVFLTLQKDGRILNTSKTGALSYSQVATVDDKGNYTCKADGNRASKASDVFINVEELFSKPLLILLRRSNNYIHEDEYLSLICSVPSLSPEDANKQEYSLIRNNHPHSTTTGGRFYWKMKESETGSYSCKVTISNITKSSDPVTIVVYAQVSKPVLKHITKDDRMVVLGDTLELICKSDSGTPPITYSLYREKDLLDRKTINNTMEARFQVEVTKPHDLGHYKCHASNRNTKSDQFSDIMNITVITPVDNVTLTIIPPNGEVEEGAELSMVCNVKNGTLPINFQFYVKKENEYMLHSVTEDVNKYSSFTVPSFTKQRDGFYFCAATNRAQKLVKSRSVDVKAVLAMWKKAVISSFIVLIIMVAIGIGVYIYLDKKKKAQEFSTEKSRTSKAHSNNDKLGVEMKNEDSYFGSMQNEEELHILKTEEENIGNNQQNHEVGYTEVVDSQTADPHQDGGENNVNRTEEAPEANNPT